jgi:hypothetical protein
MERELKSFAKIAADFLTPATITKVIPKFINDLQSIKQSGSFGTIKWQILDSLPLVTKSCEGAYEVGNPGKHDCHAEITAVWEIQPLRIKSGSSLQPKLFTLVGNASTLVRFLESSNGSPTTELGSYRIEIGTHDSPGVHFHVQVLGQAATTPFPQSLSVPRFPSYLGTPMSAAEFTLGELFQSSWRREARRNESDHQMWKSIQLDRYKNLFTWQQKVLTETGEFPLSLLKHSKPPPHLFYGH